LLEKGVDMGKLHLCPKCKENSTVRRCYTRKRDGVDRRVEYCVNVGCGYRKDLTLPKEVKCELL